MNPRTLDETFAALADSTRRKILDRLSEGEARVTDVAALFPISLNSVSKHIKLLERAQLIKRTVHGRENFLSLSMDRLDAAHDWITKKQSFWKSQLVALDQMLAAQDQPVERPRKMRG
jgi:DNA-binding transcriptional ArsR family regulator